MTFLCQFLRNRTNIPSKATCTFCIDGQPWSRGSQRSQTPVHHQLYSVAVLGRSNFPAAYLSIQSFLRVGLQVQCINCTNHIYTVVHVQDMVCMALFVRYMYTAAVLHCGNLPMALFLHTILPAGRTVSSVH